MQKTIATIGNENEKDLVDIPKKVREDIKITVVENVDEVLKIALTKELKRIEWQGNICWLSWKSII